MFIIHFFKQHIFTSHFQNNTSAIKGTKQETFKTIYSLFIFKTTYIQQIFLFLKQHIFTFHFQNNIFTICRMTSVEYDDHLLTKLMMMTMTKVTRMVKMTTTMMMMTTTTLMMMTRKSGGQSLWCPLSSAKGSPGSESQYWTIRPVLFPRIQQPDPCFTIFSSDFYFHSYLTTGSLFQDFSPDFYFLRYRFWQSSLSIPQP